MGYSFLMLRFPRGCGERNNPVEARIARPLSGGIRASASTHQPKPPLEGRCHGEAMTERCNCRGGLYGRPCQPAIPARLRQWDPPAAGSGRCRHRPLRSEFGFVRRGGLHIRPAAFRPLRGTDAQCAPLRHSEPSNAGGNPTTPLRRFAPAPLQGSLCARPYGAQNHPTLARSRPGHGRPYRPPLRRGDEGASRIATHRTRDARPYGGVGGGQLVRKN